MRCQFCGYDNPQGKEKCEKCNKPLGGSTSAISEAETVHDYVNHNRPTDRQAGNSFCPKATIREKPRQEETVCPKVTMLENSQHEEAVCPNCGYKLENGECPSCGYPQNEQNNINPRKTQRPIRKNDGNKEEVTKKVFKLTPISEETGNPEGESISYEGDNVILNRDNTDPKNSTITSTQQANVIFENDVWGIEDKSGLQTTFVQASHRIELHEGDLLLLGNQLYRFEL